MNKHNYDNTHMIHMHETHVIHMYENQTFSLLVLLLIIISVISENTLIKFHFEKLINGVGKNYRVLKLQ